MALEEARVMRLQLKGHGCQGYIRHCGFVKETQYWGQESRRRVKVAIGKR